PLPVEGRGRRRAGQSSAALELIEYKALSRRPPRVGRPIVALKHVMLASFIELTRALGFVVFLCFLAAAQLQGAETQPDGRKIYRELCVKCHGRNGEGVKGKYDDALHGDWAIEKLTRFI